VRGFETVTEFEYDLISAAGSAAKMQRIPAHRDQTPDKQNAYQKRKFLFHT
jgi:hypothetical protein